jgi:antitoxin VapB
MAKSATARTAKLFRNGRSLAVRLPVEFRFEGTEVFIRRDPTTGDVILSRRPGSWASFFKLADQAGVPDDFMSDRGDVKPQERDLF